jgi:hypothetical protein
MQAVRKEAHTAALHRLCSVDTRRVDHILSGLVENVNEIVADDLRAPH